MALAKSQKYLVVGIVVVLAAAIVAGAWYLGKDTDAQEPGKNAKDLASKFAENYDGSFGQFELNSTSTSDHAVVVNETGSSYLKYSMINYVSTSDAQSQFDEIKLKIESMEGVMGGTPTEIENIAGFDGICAYKMDIKIMQKEFTLVYFVAYVDWVLIDASEGPLYHSGSWATETEITELFAAVSASLSP
ncbi:hypothetical protein [Methanomassiliicoccus luminyensis]|uniref:hypothetical protein n=1 Tax=Methanomassiliicoccus luminyensis TaxID=1080712 RepID=UPI0011CC866C|nr:hypothetical protein [Methanomassiliicoccus luminyensis]